MKLLLIAALAPMGLAQLTGTYSQIPPANISPNPANVSTYIYLPKNLAAKPPVVVVPHWCHGSADAAFQGSAFSYASDQYGFIAIYPDSPHTEDKCWDVSSAATLTHNGGGDSQGIISALKYVLDKYNGDRRRVFVQGTSSGAMMTNVLLGAYPDVFAAGSAWAGVPFGCFAGPTPDYWNADCATGKVVKTGAEWKAVVEAAYPGYSGWRPKFQTFHGSADTTLYPQNLEEQVKEWTAVFGISATPTETLKDTPIPNWTLRRFGTEGKFEATLATGVDHGIQTQLDSVMNWFDLRCTGDNCFGRPDGGVGGGSGSTTTLKTSTTTSKPSTTTATSKPVTTTSAATKTSSAVGGSNSGAAQWAQCGGSGWTGQTTCSSPYKCSVVNDWYSQCQ